MNRAVWPGKSRKSRKPWGYEIEWRGLFSGKEIHIESGKRTSLKFNTHKTELLYVSTGKVSVECADEMHLSDPIRSPSRVLVLSEGDFLNVQAGCPYRVTALQNSIIFELSDSSRSAREQRVILEDDYGREEDQSGKWIFNTPKK